MKFEIAPKSTEIQANWYDARLYCFSLKVDGKVGWRLPTREELNEIYQSENEIYQSENDYDQERYYWSSTEFNSGYYWIQYFSSGNQTSHYKKVNNHVRAVRDLKDN